MGEEHRCDAPVTGDFTECLSSLKGLSKEEILGILGDGEGLCGNCELRFKTRIQNFVRNKSTKLMESNDTGKSSEEFFWSLNASTPESLSKTSESVHSRMQPRNPESAHSGTRRSYANNVSYASINNKEPPLQYISSQVIAPSDDLLEDPNEEHSRIAKVGRKKDFSYIERVGGIKKNVLQGLELHTGVFNPDEQKKIVDCVYDLQKRGRQGQLRERTYLEPTKWMKGKGRVTIQFGCCYNYAKDKYGNPPGIIRDEEVDPLPPLFKKMIKRMVRWRVLPPTCVPNSCIVNIYNAGDCIPPHIDHHDFIRPFCTVSFLAECKILFGTSLKVIDEGEFDGPVSIPLPLGSVLILSGNGADVAKHCVPSVPAKRISITFRKMDESKLPYKYLSDPDLVGIQPLVRSQSTNSRVLKNQPEEKEATHREPARVVARPNIVGPIFDKEEDFPALGSSGSSNKRINGIGKRR